MEKSCLRNSRGNTGLIWKNVLGWVKESTGGPPLKLYDKGRMETSPKSLASIMNKFYIVKIKKIRESLPPKSSEPHLNRKCVTKKIMGAQMGIQCHWVPSNFKKLEENLEKRLNY